MMRKGRSQIKRGRVGPISAKDSTTEAKKSFEHATVVKKLPHQSLFRLFSSFQTNIIIFYTNMYVKISIKYTVLGLEPTTFRT